MFNCTSPTGVTASPDWIEKAQNTARSPRLREASFDDHPRIAALQARHALEAKSCEEWKHLWLDNPAYKKSGTRLPIGWVLEANDKGIVGYLGNIPLLYELEGEQLLISVAHSWVVEPPYRSYALALLERYFAQTVVDLFLNATVGPAASDSFAVFGSSPVPVGAWDRSLFWITNYKGFMASWLATKQLPLTKLSGYLLSPLPFLRDLLSGQSRRAAPSGVELQVCLRIDDRFDTFWNVLAKQGPHILRAVRTKEVLEWHFGPALSRGRAWILSAVKNSLIVSYAIFCRYDSAKVGLKRMRVVDFQALAGYEFLIRDVMSWALERCRNDGIHMLESIGFRADKQTIMAEFSPYERMLPSWLYFYHANQRCLAEKLSNVSVWDPSQFDGDASL